MEKSQGRRRERPAGRERRAEEAIERHGEVMNDEERMRQAQLRAARQQQAARLLGKAVIQRAAADPQQP